MKSHTKERLSISSLNNKKEDDKQEHQKSTDGMDDPEQLVADW